MLKGHGDDAYRYEKPIFANFSSNVWFGGQSEELKQHLFKKWEIINRYPEPIAESLAAILAEDLKIHSEQILVTNGATEAFYLIAQCFRNSNSTILIPTFSEYEDACTINKHKLSFINWKDLNCSEKIDSDIIWVCNPNNPTGSVISKKNLKKLLITNPHATIIIDEAYIDFTDAISSAIDLIDEHPNLILVKSLTKNFAIPGLRLGYLLASKEMVQNIKFYKAPWTVNSLAIEAGKYVLNYKSKILPPVNYYKSTTKKFKENLSKIEGIKIHPSKTSYFLIELEKGNSFDLKNYLISEFRILIRDASNFRGLNSSFIRIATQTDEKNQLLIDALQKWSKLN